MCWDAITRVTLRRWIISAHGSILSIVLQNVHFLLDGTHIESVELSIGLFHHCEPRWVVAATYCLGETERTRVTGLHFIPIFNQYGLAVTVVSDASQRIFQ